MVRKNFTKIKLITNNENLGFAKGNNIGIKAARGSLIVLLNNDVVVHPAWLSELVRAALASRRIGMTEGTVLEAYPSDTIWSLGNRIDGFTGIGWSIGRGKKPEEIAEAQNMDFFPACALLVKREVVDRIGPLDEGFFVYGEDVDWVLRARRAGYECRLATSAVVWHEVSATSKKALTRRYYWYNRGHFRLILMHFPLAYVFTAFFSQLVLLSLFEILLFRRPLSYVLLKFRAFVYDIADLSRTLVERRKIQLLGKPNVKIRLRECLELATLHASTGYLPGFLIPTSEIVRGRK
jgi:hypothetical protein